jgi:phosphoribosylformylglycinamidine cyclo-ligase
MYATFNMGVGFAVFVAADQADRCVQIAASSGYEAWIGGRVHQDGSRKAVEITPANITFNEDSLQVR